MISFFLQKTLTSRSEKSPELKTRIVFVTVHFVTFCTWTCLLNGSVENFVRRSRTNVHKCVNWLWFHRTFRSDFCCILSRRSNFSVFHDVLTPIHVTSHRLLRDRFAQVTSQRCVVADCKHAEAGSFFKAELGPRIRGRLLSQLWECVTVSFLSVTRS